MLIDLPIKPGIIKENTDVLSEGRWIDADKMRFRNVGGKIYPEIIGGYEALTSQTFRGEARGVHAWSLTDGTAVFAFGTNTGLYAYAETYLWDITPIRENNTLSGVMGTTDGSAVVRINDSSHGLEENCTVWLHNDTTLNGVNLGQDSNINELTSAIGSRILTITTFGNHLVENGDKVTVSGAIATGGVLSASINTTHTVAYVDSDTIAFCVETAATSSATTGSGSYIALYAYDVTTIVDANNYDITLRTGTANATSSGGGGTLTYYYGINPGLATSTSSEDARTWALSNFGFDLVANYRGSALYRWQGNYSIPAAAVAATDAPAENLAHMVTPERFLVALGTEDAATSTYDAMRVAWAKIEGGFTTNDWTPSSTNSAGDFLLAEGSKIINGVSMPFVSLIWTDTALYQIQYIESLDTVYRPTLIGTTCGLIGPNAFARVGDSGQVFWLSTTQEFMLWQGGAPITVQCPVREFFFDKLASGQEAKIFAGVNAKFNEVWWYYPDANDTDVIRYVVLNYAELHWTVGTMPVTSWIERGVFDYPIGLHLNGTIHEHEKGDDADGSALDARIESGLMDAQEGENLSLWRRFVPDVQSLVGNMEVTMKYRMWPQDTESETSIGTVTSSTTKLDFRITARQIGFRFDFDSTNTSGRIGRIAFDVIPTGAKR